MIISGKEIATDLKREMAVKVKELEAKYGRVPHLVVVLVGDDPGSVSYVTGKAKASEEIGVRNTTIRKPESMTEGELLSLIAELNADGRFRIIGRRDNTVNTGGVKVQIEEVEAALAPHISRPFAITSVPDPKFGERIVMLVQGSIAEEEARRAFSALPPYWRPKQTFCVEKLPQTGTGKPDRAAARETARRLADGEQQ